MRDKQYVVLLSLDDSVEYQVVVYAPTAREAERKALREVRCQVVSVKRGEG